MKYIVYWSIAAIIILRVMIAPYINKKPTEIKYTMSANALHAAYERNSVAADLKYEKKWVKVSGTVKDIGTELLGKPYIIIGDDGFLEGVRCVFNRGDESIVGKVSKGSEIAILGKVIGQFTGTSVIMFDYKYVLMNDCEIK